MPKPYKKTSKPTVKASVKAVIKPAEERFAMLGITWSTVLILLAATFLYQFKPAGKENAGKASAPGFAFTSWFDGSFQKKYEEYLKTNSNFGKKLTPLKNQLDFWLFNKINVNGFTLGKDHYIFSIGYIEAYLGRDYSGEKVITEKIRKAKVIQDTLKKKGIDIIYIFAPGKGSFCTEYLPRKYQRLTKHITNYETYIAISREYGINYVDFQSWFLKIKPLSKYPLFPQYGHHWSYFGECLAADSIIRYIESIHHCSLPHIGWSNIVYPSEPKVRDGDIIKKAKLLKEPVSIPMAYPELQYTAGKDAKPLKVLGIGDSYYRGFLYLGVMQNVFDNGEFWYYYNTVVPEADPVKEVWEYDLKEKIEESKVVLVLNSDGNLPKMGSGFIEDAYLLYTNPKEYKKYYEKKRAISSCKKQIRQNPDLLNEAIKMSVEMNIREDSALTLKALEIIQEKK